MYQAFSELHSAQAVDLMQDIIDVYIYLQNLYQICN